MLLTRERKQHTLNGARASQMGVGSRSGGGWWWLVVIVKGRKEERDEDETVSQNQNQNGADSVQAQGRTASCLFL